MSAGIASFFKYKKLGFYRYREDEYLSMRQKNFIIRRLPYTYQPEDILRNNGKYALVEHQKISENGKLMWAEKNLDQI
ncbi:hypothetical protein ACT3D0_001814 [Vibrio vulnificus]